jgi:ribosomal protein S27AE
LKKKNRKCPACGTVLTKAQFRIFEDDAYCYHCNLTYATAKMINGKAKFRIVGLKN